MLRLKGPRRPVALTDCLNFGDPERPDVQYQLAQAIAGIRAACEALDVPVVSGNVSLYNEAAGAAIYPTPVIGALGVLDNVSRHATAGFRREGDTVALLGAASLAGEPGSLGVPLVQLGAVGGGRIRIAGESTYHSIRLPTHGRTDWRVRRRASRVSVRGWPVRSAGGGDPGSSDVLPPAA